MKELAPIRTMAVLLLALALLGSQAALPPSTMDRLSWSALADATVTFQPSAPVIAIGGEVWVAIRINNVQDLTAADVRLSFDRTVVQVLDADGVSGDPVGLQKGTMPYPDLVLRNEANNGLGEIWYITTQLAPRAPANGTGTLATIHLRGLRDGSTTIYFTNHDLAGDQGYEVPHTVGSCTVTVGSGAATPLATLTATPSHTTTLTPTRTGTPTVTATPSHTATASLTPTPGPSPTPTSSPTITQTPTQTQTPLPSPTASQTPTITATPIAAQRTFSGYVYAGSKGNRTVPLSGVEIKLWGAWVAGTHGFYLTKTNTDYQGRFQLTYTASYPHYSVIESDPAGYQSVGAIAGPGGFVLDQPEGNWVEFRDTTAGEYAGTEFYDLPDSSTSTPTPTQGGATLTPTVGTPTATSEPSGLPIYVSERALADTFLNAREPDVMNGRLGHLHLGMSAQGPHKNALVWFDLSDIPVGSTVREATLFLFGRDVDSTIPLCVEGLTADWEEYQATWQQPADGLSWDQLGALGSGDADGQCVSGSFKDAGRVQYYEWNVGALVNAWLQGQRPNQGFMIHIARGTKAKETHGLYSREYSETALRPMLSIVFWEPTPTPTASNTPTPTMTATATHSPTPTGEPRLVLPLVLRGSQ